MPDRYDVNLEVWQQIFLTPSFQTSLFVFLNRFNIFSHHASNSAFHDSTVHRTFKYNFITSSPQALFIPCCLRKQREPEIPLRVNLPSIYILFTYEKETQQIATLVHIIWKVSICNWFWCIRGMTYMQLIINANEEKQETRVKEKKN